MTWIGFLVRPTCQAEACAGPSVRLRLSAIVYDRLVSHVTPLAAPLGPVHVTSQDLARLTQTPLLLASRLAQRHHEILLPRLLAICAALAQRLLLLLPLCLSTAVLAALRLARCSRRYFAFLGGVSGEAREPDDRLGRDRIINVSAGRESVACIACRSAPEETMRATCLSSF